MTPAQVVERQALLDEVDRLRTQVERDRPVVEAAVFWHRHRRRGSQYVGDAHLARVMVAREAALDSEVQPSAPDEATEEET